MTELRPLPYPWPEVKHRLQKSLPAVLERLGLRYAEASTAETLHPLNPTRNDKRPGSFVIWTQGTAAGAWKEYAGVAAKGDLFDLIAYVLRLQAKIDAYWWALEFLGLDRGRVRTKAEDIQARERREKDAAAELVKNAAAAKARQGLLFGLWIGLPGIKDTPAEHYLRAVRGIPMERLQHWPGALKWADQVEWVEPETGEVFEWRNGMISAMTAGKAVTALHRTWLKADGSAKAGRGKDKTMIGTASGAAIRVSPGPSGLSPTRAEAKGRRDPLVITEGIEDALTLAVARPDCRVWAAGSLDLMRLFDWPGCASAVVLCADNDWDKPEAMAGFARVETHWRRQALGLNRAVHVVRAQAGKDFNDLVKP